MGSPWRELVVRSSWVEVAEGGEGGSGVSNGRGGGGNDDLDVAEVTDNGDGRCDRNVGVAKTKDSYAINGDDDDDGQL